jgi:hypothetical protein
VWEREDDRGAVEEEKGWPRYLFQGYWSVNCCELEEEGFTTSARKNSRSDSEGTFHLSFIFFGFWTLPILGEACSCWG